jgi:AraC-like DNA-binding protein
MPISAKKSKIPPPQVADWLKTLRPFVRQSGDDRRPPWLLGRRKLLDYLAVYVNRGEGVFELEDDRFPVGPGTLFWVPPDTFHAMRGTGEEMNCLYLHFDLLYDPARSHWDAYVMSDTTDFGEWTPRRHPPLADAELNRWRGALPLIGNQLEILRLFREIHRSFQAEAAYSGATTGLFWQLLAAIYQGLHDDADDDSAAGRIRRSREFIRAHFARREVNTAALARKFSFSEAHFRASFRAETGMTPHDFLLSCRLEHARELLSYTDLAIGRIAELAGFASIYDFSRAFRRRYGSAPSRVRGS